MVGYIKGRRGIGGRVDGGEVGRREEDVRVMGYGGIHKRTQEVAVEGNLQDEASLTMATRSLSLLSVVLKAESGVVDADRKKKRGKSVRGLYYSIESGIGNETTRRMWNPRREMEEVFILGTLSEN
jgi:hypothetical protein